jgi:acetyl-CoA carboxylase carboxyl transferase subunit beta
MDLATALRLPLVSVIDTAGAELSTAAEESGLAREIAHCLAAMLAVPSPTISVLLGQGAGGAALALLPADTVVAAQNAWLSPLPPEGASVIVHHSTSFAAHLADAQRIRAADLAAAGVVDELIAEVDDAADEPERFCRHARAALRNELARLMTADLASRITRRARRYGAPVRGGASSRSAQ